MASSNRARHIFADEIFPELREFVEENDLYSDDDEVEPHGDLEANTFIRVTSIDTNISENTIEHKTEKYARFVKYRTDLKDALIPSKVEVPGLIVRRGGKIKLTINLDKQYDKDKHDLRVCFLFGKVPRPFKGTLVEIPLAERNKDKQLGPTGWEAKVLSVEGLKTVIEVTVPATCIVGEWKLILKTVCKVKDGDEKEKIFEFDSKKKKSQVIILFNPWCEDDSTYMAEDGRNLNLDEYVLNESSCVFVGSKWSSSARSWMIGQFEEVCLQAALKLLESMMDQDRSDAVIVSRYLAKMVNCADDYKGVNGVLAGNWSGNYDGGKNPSYWKGSTPILEEFMKTGENVKYGQCWVFAMVTNTVGRTLGLPIRAVTNFGSAHDTDCSRTIDKVFRRNADGDLVKDKYESSDSIWNFHVWNEVWMKRPDLDKNDQKGKYDGWQAVDATPQETSTAVYGYNEIHTCGPASINAIKNGECHLGFDTGFVFSEVNADVIHWEKKGNREYVAFKVEPGSVGNNISTKTPDGRMYAVWRRKHMRLVVTDHYKHPEGSKEEEMAVRMAINSAGPNALVGEFNIQTVKAEILTPEETMIGDDVKVDVKVTNTGRSKRYMNKAQIRLKAEEYVGRAGKPFYREDLPPFTLGPGESTYTSVTVPVTVYYEHLIDQCLILAEVQFEVDQVSRAEPEQTVFEEKVFQLTKPELKVECAKENLVTKEADFTVEFINPLHIPLTNCYLTMESTVGMENMKDIKLEDVPAKGKFRRSLSIKPREIGEHSVTFAFESSELFDIEGDVGVVVIDKKVDPTTTLTEVSGSAGAAGTGGAGGAALSGTGTGTGRTNASADKPAA